MENMKILYLLHLCQIYIDIITRVIRVPLLLVLLYFLLQEQHDLFVVGVDSLVRSWQVLQQAREGIIQLFDGTKSQISYRSAVQFVL